MPEMGEMGGESAGAEEPPQESFFSGEGELLTEEDNLPSWKQLGLNYTDWNK